MCKPETPCTGPFTLPGLLLPIEQDAHLTELLALRRGDPYSCGIGGVASDSQTGLQHILQSWCLQAHSLGVLSFAFNRSRLLTPCFIR